MKMSLDKQKCRQSTTGNKTILTKLAIKYVKNLPKEVILLKTKGLKRSKSLQKGSKSYGRVDSIQKIVSAYGRIMRTSFASYGVHKY